MKTGKLVLIILAINLISNVSFAKEPTPKSIKKLFEVMQMEKQFKESRKMMTGIQFQSFKGNPEMSKVMSNFQDKYFNWKVIEGDFMKIYSEAFTDNEIKQLIDFHQTPIGKKLIAKQPLIQQEIMKLTMEMTKKHTPELQKTIMDLMKKK